MLREPEADAESNSRAILIRHIPFGFFEKEILKYFLQFGNVRRVRVPRNKKTGNHKGWAFVLFTDHVVAQLAAEAMDGYLMFEKRLECKVIKNKNFPPCLRKGPRIIPPPLKNATRKLHARKLNKKQSGWCEEAAKERLLKNMKIRGNKFAKLGYQLPLIASCSEAQQVMFVTNEGSPLKAEEIKSEDTEIKIQCKPFKKSVKSHCSVKFQRKKEKNVE
uniref:RRM domain-containing protein n=1 Tax=Setaria digitata TaxID=48799 RepID=A0A915PWC2_9BILA